MASCSFTSTGRKFTLDVVETSYSIANNTSDIKWTLTISGGGSTWYTTYAKVTVNGSVVYSESKDWSAGTFPAKDGSISGTIKGIPHDSQGKKTISFALEGYSEVFSTQYANGSLPLTSIPRYFTSIPKLELVSKTETSATIKWTTSENASRSQYKIDSGSWVDVETNINKSTGTMTISGLKAGKSYTIYADFMRSDSGLWCETKPSLNLTTYDYPYIISANKQDLLIGDTQVLNLYNPLSHNVSIKMNKDTINGTELYNGTTNEETLIFTPKENTLYASIPNSQSGMCIYSVVYEDIINSLVGNYTYKVKGTEIPTFNDFTYKDSNIAVISVTGNDQVLVQGLSNLEVTISSSNKMIANNSSTPVNYTAIIDTLNKTVDYSTNDIKLELGTVINSGSKRLTLTAYDSRLLYKSTYKDITVYEYTRPEVNISATRLNNFEAETTLKVNGTYTRLTINSTDKNTIQSVKYRYRETGETWSDWVVLNTTVTTGKFTCSDVILSLDNTKSFEFEVQAFDKLHFNSKSATVNVGRPIFLVSSNKKTCYMNGEELLTHGLSINVSNKDANTICSTGFYYGNDMMNTPSEHGYLLVIGHSISENYCLQAFFPQGGNISYFHIRQKNNGTWGNWFKFTGTLPV